MQEVEDSYKTIKEPVTDVLFKEKKSKFISYAYPISTEEEVKPIIETLQLQYPNANHVCYAWQLGVKNVRYRANDDGEPNNSAGMPIYGQLQAFELTNILVAVVRIFGGVKLGVGGLISAYRTAAQLALEEAKICTQYQQSSLQLQFAYEQMNNVMRLIKKHQLDIIAQRLEMDCSITLQFRASKLAAVKEDLSLLRKVKVKILTP
ncbi:IMPACT family protein [Croceivirga sp. JEA036]|uniref:IMPACT family protein n=1 Tax=Croceivirga sp. JEA036 TaxID=2721162 RepID=UPI0014398E3B|nr:YigZ family protein [Croceivirga sp. JEA036]NJB35884.1 YigZ family protein [Croceivirga sp. JEA036]